MFTLNYIKPLNSLFLVRSSFALITFFFFCLGHKISSVLIVFVMFLHFAVVAKNSKVVNNNKINRKFWKALVHLFPANREDLSKINANRCLFKSTIVILHIV